MTSRSNIETSFFLTGQAQTAAELGIPLNGSVPFSVTAWVSFASVETAADILTKPGVFSFGMEGRQLYVEIEGFPALWSDGVTNPITQDAWHYVACVYTGTQLQLYIDGMLDCLAGVSGSGTDNANPFIIANNLQGSLNSVRVYNTALPAGWVLEAMFQPDSAQDYVANFDFTLNPPADTSSHNLPLTLSGTTSTDVVTPSVGLLSSAYCQPIRDNNVNPGGAGNDPYSIQAWVWVESPTATLTSDGLVPGGQAIFVNQSLDAPTGVALYLSYDTSANLYRLASLRGDVTVSGTSLISLATIPFGQWVNVATTYDPATTTLSLYIDGQPDNSSDAFPLVSGLTAPDILIGGAVIGSQPASNWTLQGYIQTVDVWNITLTGTQIQQWQTDYPVQETGLTAHYDFSSYLARNENNGSPVGLADRAVILSQTTPAGEPDTTAAAASRQKGGHRYDEPYYEQLPPDEMARLRAGISFPDSPELERLLDEAMQRELEAPLHLLVPAAMVPRVRARLAAEWTRVRRLMRERPQELRFVLTYHKIRGEHVLIHHTPVRSTVVFRAPVADIDDCTMWRIRVIWTIVMGLLSVFGITASLTNKALQFIQTRILGNAALMRAIGNIPRAVTASGLFAIIVALQTFGVLWPLIKIALTTMGWWALGKLLVKILVKFFGAAVAVAETIASLIVAVVQLIIVLSSNPDPNHCPLILPGLEPVSAPTIPRLAPEPAMA